MKKIILLILILLLGNETFAHQDFYVSFKFGNIQTRIKTGYEYEQINVSKIIGKLARKLSLKHNYSKPILLDFTHAYINEIEPDYFLSYGNGEISYTWSNEKPKKVLKKKGLVIRQVSHEFDAEATLKLVEYCILNSKEIEETQYKIDYHKNYCQWNIRTINPIKIQFALNEKSSFEIEEVIKEKTFLNSANWETGIDYFYQNREFHFLLKSNNRRKETIALSTSHLFQIVKLPSDKKIVFDSDSTFYLIGWIDSIRVKSDQHKISNVKNNFKLFKIENEESNLISITLIRYATQLETEEDESLIFKKTSQYDIKKDKFIDNVPN